MPGTTYSGPEVALVGMGGAVSMLTLVGRLVTTAGVEETGSTPAVSEATGGSSVAGALSILLLAEDSMPVSLAATAGTGPAEVEVLMLLSEGENGAGSTGSTSITVEVVTMVLVKVVYEVMVDLLPANVDDSAETETGEPETFSRVRASTPSIQEAVVMTGNGAVVVIAVLYGPTLSGA